MEIIDNIPVWGGVVSMLDKYPGICYNRLWHSA